MSFQATKNEIGPLTYISIAVKCRQVICRRMPAEHLCPSSSMGLCVVIQSERHEATRERKKLSKIKSTSSIGKRHRLRAAFIFPRGEKIRCFRIPYTLWFHQGTKKRYVGGRTRQSNGNKRIPETTLQSLELVNRRRLSPLFSGKALTDASVRKLHLLAIFPILTPLKFSMPLSMHTNQGMMGLWGISLLGLGSNLSRHACYGK